MAYDSYDNDEPDGTTNNGTAFASGTKVNLDALRDAIVTGSMENWDLTVTAGTGSAEAPQYLTYTNGVRYLRLTVTYDGDEYVSTVLYEYSTNSGGAYDTIGTITYSYDASKNITGWSWS